MQIIPIISTLRRHKTAAALIVLEIAFTCAIVCNTIFVIRQRLARMDQPSGVVENELVDVRLAGVGTKTDAYAVTAQDIAALRTIPGVKNVASSNMVPFGESSWNTSVSTIADDPNGPSASFYLGSEDFIQTLGVQIVAGRAFRPDEFQNFDVVKKQTGRVSSIILTRDLAERVFHGENALGKTVYVMGHGQEPQTVVGIVDRLVRPNDFGHPENAYLAMILPVRTSFADGGQYLLRIDPASRASVIAAIDDKLTHVDNARIILDRRPFSEIRAKKFAKDRSMAWLLVGVSLALLVITALGVVGLASFWVQQRTRQIGIRRALGATRGDIRRYFQVENFILATAGIVLGMALAYGINLWLMHHYQVARLPGEFLPIGALLLWLLGQVAVLGPAMRAATIPPAIATRTV